MTAAKIMHKGFRLSELLDGLAPVSPLQDREILTVTLDSRQVIPGSLFLACSGGRRHGADFIEDAIARGAVAVVREPGPVGGSGRVPTFDIPSLRTRAGAIAARFYGDPSRTLSVTGVTGTNGKTSVAWFAAQLCGKEVRCGVIGTLGAGLLDELRNLGHTTPDAVAVQRELARMRDMDARRVVMEVSSHALDQHRVDGVRFRTAVFTNLSRDHLDYHGDMAAYAAAKRRLLEWPGLSHAVINVDDPVGRDWWGSRSLSGKAVGYSLQGLRPGDSGRPVVLARDIRLGPEGIGLEIITPWGEAALQAPLLGRFNVSNLLAACAVALVDDVPIDSLAGQVGRLRTPPGRMERFAAPGKPLTVVDYAHTPDALEQALRALREHAAGRIWCVFGCGGERDRGKRPMMGGIAERFADDVLLTDDNPRGEESAAIIEDIMGGISEPERVRVIPDRAEAIARAVCEAAEGDVVLVAGKGHEDYQMVGGETHHFSDRAVVRRLLGGGDG